MFIKALGRLEVLGILTDIVVAACMGQERRQADPQEHRTQAAASVAFTFAEVAGLDSNCAGAGAWRQSSQAVDTAITDCSRRPGLASVAAADSGLT